MPQFRTVIMYHTFYHNTKFRNAMFDEGYSFKRNMMFGHESKILQICQKFHLNSKMYCKPSVTVLMLIKGISVIF